MQKLHALCMSSALALAMATPGFAGVVDTDVPQISASGTANTVFIVPGVIKNNNLETVFLCTSLETFSPIAIGVEVFDSLGAGPLNNASMPTLEGVETVDPGETVLIATGPTAGLHENDIMESLVPASLRNGSARIISTSKRIMCNAFLVDEINDPPTLMAPLHLISKKQKGD